MSGNAIARAKKVMNQFDPALVASAIKELSMIPQRIEPEDIESVKAQIRALYDKLPKTKDRSQIIVRALDEVNTEVLTVEIEKIKDALAKFDRDVLLEASKALEIPVCGHASIVCLRCLYQDIGPCQLYLVGPCQLYHVGPCQFFAIDCKFRFIGGCRSCVSFLIYCGHCISYQLPYEIDPIQVIPPVLQEKLIQQVFDSPQLTRAVRAMILQMKERGEI